MKINKPDVAGENGFKEEKKRDRYKGGSISPMLYLLFSEMACNALVTILGPLPIIQVFPFIPGITRGHVQWPCLGACSDSTVIAVEVTNGHVQVQLLSDNIQGHIDVQLPLYQQNIGLHKFK